MTDKAPERSFILDPAKEERRQWADKRAGKDLKRTRAAVMLLCEFCGKPLGPDALVFDKGEKRACTTCAVKP